MSAINLFLFVNALNHWDLEALRSHLCFFCPSKIQRLFHLVRFLFSEPLPPHTLSQVKENFVNEIIRAALNCQDFISEAGGLALSEWLKSHREEERILSESEFCLSKTFRLTTALPPLSSNIFSAYLRKSIIALRAISRIQEAGISLTLTKGIVTGASFFAEGCQKVVESPMGSSEEEEKKVELCEEGYELATGICKAEQMHVSSQEKGESGKEEEREPEVISYEWMKAQLRSARQRYKEVKKLVDAYRLALPSPSCCLQLNHEQWVTSYLHQNGSEYTFAGLAVSDKFWVALLEPRGFRRTTHSRDLRLAFAESPFSHWVTVVISCSSPFKPAGIAFGNGQFLIVGTAPSDDSEGCPAVVTYTSDDPAGPWEVEELLAGAVAERLAFAGDYFFVSTHMMEGSNDSERAMLLYSKEPRDDWDVVFLDEEECDMLHYCDDVVFGQGTYVAVLRGRSRNSEDDNTYSLQTMQASDPSLFSPSSPLTTVTTGSWNLHDASLARAVFGRGQFVILHEVDRVIRSFTARSSNGPWLARTLEPSFPLPFDNERTFHGCTFVYGGGLFFACGRPCQAAPGVPFAAWTDDPAAEWEVEQLNYGYGSAFAAAFSQKDGMFAVVTHVRDCSGGQFMQFLYQRCKARQSKK